MQALCCIKGCDNPISNKKRSWCRAHYERWRKHGDPLAGYNSRGVRMQFLNDALNSDTDDCIIFPFCSPNQRYGFVKFDGRQHLAHRVVCKIAHGKQPTSKHEVGHVPKCKSGKCINPRHVRWVTSSQNNLKDKIDSGTIMRGERHHKHKLDEKDVLRIRRMHKTGNYTGVELSDIFDVSSKQISRIVRREAWFWLEDRPKPLRF